MPLSEEELRLLEQMERALVEEDPKLASTLRGTSQQHLVRRRIVLGSALLVAGIAVLVAAVLLTVPVLGVLGFVVMLGGAAIAITAMMTPAQAPAPSARETGRAGLGVVDGGKAHRPRRQRSNHSFMERLEERWRHRRERGF